MSCAKNTPSRSRKFVRSFLFSVRIDSPLARLHVLTKLFAILALSLVIVQFINTEEPDPIGIVLLILLTLLALHLCGVLRWVFRSYLLVIFPALLGMALVWVAFNPDRGGGVLLEIPIYSGELDIGISLGLGLFLAVSIAWYVVRKEILWGLIAGIALSVAVTSLLGNPGITLAHVSFFHPLTVVVSKNNLFVAVTKSLGYGGMIFISLLLVMTTRDIEFIGVMRQVRIPYVVAFFVSTMLRSLNMALVDYGTIRQAQVARGVSLKRKNLFRVIADMAYMAVPLTASILRRSSEVGDAILIRGFTMKTKAPTEFHEVRPFALADGVVVGVCILFLIATFGFHLNFTRWMGLL